MIYSLLRISKLYDNYINDYEKTHYNYSFLNYDEQYFNLIHHSQDLSGSYEKSFNDIGVKATNIIFNARKLQERWAIEHNINPLISSIDLIFEQVKYYKPDIVWLDTSQLFDRKWINNLKNEISSIKLIIGHICSPVNAKMIESYSSFDLILACSTCIQKELATYGIKAELLYHGFDHSILNYIETDKNQKKIDVVFTGSLFTGFGFHKRRIEFIERLIESNIAIKTFGNIESRKKKFFKQCMNRILVILLFLKCNFLIEKIHFLKKYKNYGKEKIKYYSNDLLKTVHSPIFGLEMFQLLNNSKICFNIHGGNAERKCAGNMRLFESTGIGTCLITDWKENISDFFEIDKEIITYKTVEECITKIKWLLNNPIEAEKIAKAGQMRTLNDHTILKRVKDLDVILRNNLRTKYSINI